MASNWPDSNHNNQPEMAFSPSNQHGGEDMLGEVFMALTPEEQEMIIQALNTMSITSMFQASQNENTGTETSNESAPNNCHVSRPRSSTMEHASIEDHQRAQLSREMAHGQSRHRSHSVSDLNLPDGHKKAQQPVPALHITPTPDLSDVEMGGFSVCPSCK